MFSIQLHECVHDVVVNIFCEPERGDKARCCITYWQSFDFFNHFVHYLPLSLPLIDAGTIVRIRSIRWWYLFPVNHQNVCMYLLVSWYSSGRNTWRITSIVRFGVSSRHSLSAICAVVRPFANPVPLPSMYSGKCLQSSTHCRCIPPWGLELAAAGFGLW